MLHSFCCLKVFYHQRFSDVNHWLRTINNSQHSCMREKRKVQCGVLPVRWPGWCFMSSSGLFKPYSCSLLPAECSAVHSGNIWPKSAPFPLCFNFCLPFYSSLYLPPFIMLQAQRALRCWPSSPVSALHQSPTIVKWKYDSHLWWVPLSNTIQELLFIWFKIT